MKPERRREADRSAFVANGIRARKPCLESEILVSRLPSGGYGVELRFEEEPGVFTKLPIAHLEPDRGKWRLLWTSGNGIWQRLDERLRSMDEALDAIARDDYGCFLG